MKKREGILWGLVVISLSVSLYLLFFQQASTKPTENTGKNGFVDITVVFEKFEMKKELQVKLEKDLINKQAVMDSIMFQLQTLNNKLESTPNPSQEEIMEFQGLQQYYMQQKQMFDNYTQEQTNAYDAQILEQLSQYIKDYGFNNGYTFIFGASGNGNLLYGEEAKDITDEVVLYINQSYQGK